MDLARHVVTSITSETTVVVVYACSQGRCSDSSNSSRVALKCQGLSCTHLARGVLSLITATWASVWSVCQPLCVLEAQSRASLQP